MSNNAWQLQGAQCLEKFRETSDSDLTFLHKDEFEKQYEGEYSYPIVLKLNGELSVFISTQKLNEISKPEALIELIKERAI